MSTIRALKAVRASAIGGAATALTIAALPLVGAGTAQANANPVMFGTLDLWVQYEGGGLSLWATVLDGGNPDGVTEWCSYHSVGTGETLPIPFDSGVALTGRGPSAPIWIPAPQLGGTWDVTVSCNGSGNSASHSVIY
ncbi:hypothetical protein [Mycobacterium sp. 1274756.6]|uniref:hypothetical protein n=1 Tax=Mycobacterium sp. 1274756.6 TaxID=1834076 RepID=UPI0007FEE833|nr:hypothetical protein [Mycobacterium sp. 1274756.6]OBJ70937.1 hypothetical protein A5643_08495 [Mycobacterium sp. 1274756.6]